MINRRDVFMAAILVGLVAPPTHAGDRSRACAVSDDPEPILGAIGGACARIISDDPEPIGATVSEDPEPFASIAISDGPEPIDLFCINDNPDPFGASIDDDPAVVHGFVTCIGRAAILVWVAR